MGQVAPNALLSGPVAGGLVAATMADDPRISRLSIEFNRAKQEEKDRLSFSREEGALPDFHLHELADLLKLLGLDDTDAGLSDTAVLFSRKTYGKNIIVPPKANPIWMWLGFFFGGFNGFLWFAAALSWVAWALGYLVRSSHFNTQPFFRCKTALLPSIDSSLSAHSLRKNCRLRLALSFCQAQMYTW